MDHGDVDPADATGSRGLVLASQAPVAHEPREGTLDDPPLRKHDEGALSNELGHDLQCQTESLGAPVLQLALVARVGEDALEPRELLLTQGGEQRFVLIPVLHIGRVHRNGPDQPERVGDQVPLASGDPLPGVVALAVPFPLCGAD